MNNSKSQYNRKNITGFYEVLYDYAPGYNSVQSRVAISVIMNTLVESEHNRTTEFKLMESSLKRRNNSDLQLLFFPLYHSIDGGGCML